jgi:hypothetical protein
MTGPSRPQRRTVVQSQTVQFRVQPVSSYVLYLADRAGLTSSDRSGKCSVRVLPASSHWSDLTEKTIQNGGCSFPCYGLQRTSHLDPRAPLRSSVASDGSAETRTVSSTVSGRCWVHQGEDWNWTSRAVKEDYICATVNFGHIKSLLLDPGVEAG